MYDYLSTLPLVNVPLRATPHHEKFLVHRKHLLDLDCDFAHMLLIP
jgi:hypothetical protein